MGSSNRNNVQTMALSLMFPEFACASRPFAIHRPAFSRSAIQLAEDEDAYRLSARVPGVAAAGVKVTITDDTQLHIVAKSDGDETVIKRTMARYPRFRGESGGRGGIYRQHRGKI